MAQGCPGLPAGRFLEPSRGECPRTCPALPSCAPATAAEVTARRFLWRPPGCCPLQVSLWCPSPGGGAGCRVCLESGLASSACQQPPGRVLPPSPPHAPSRGGACSGSSLLKQLGHAWGSHLQGTQLECRTGEVLLYPWRDFLASSAPERRWWASFISPELPCLASPGPDNGARGPPPGRSGALALWSPGCADCSEKHILSRSTN